MRRIEQYAISYGFLGFYVLPLQNKSKRPHPYLAKEGLYSATNDSVKILSWFIKNPNINIGIACQPSGLVVFDVDERNGGSIEGLPPTRTIKTGNGYHYYYKADSSMNFPGKYRQGIDIKWRGYVVAAPSIHPSGSTYEICDNRSIAEIGAWYK